MFAAATSALRTAARTVTVPARAPLALPPVHRASAKPHGLHQVRAFSAAGVPEKLWKLGRLNHVAIAVPAGDLDSKISLYRDVLGGDVSATEDLPAHGVTTVFVDLGNTKLELLHPLGADSPILGFLKKNPDGGIHHICIEVDDIRAAVTDLTAGGIRALNKEPKIGAHGKPVVFLHPKDCGGILLELEEA